MLIKSRLIAKQQPKPLIGDEHYPDGCVCLSLQKESFTYEEVYALVAELDKIAMSMQRS